MSVLGNIFSKKKPLQNSTPVNSQYAATNPVSKMGQSIVSGQGMSAISKAANPQYSFASKQSTPAKNVSSQQNSSPVPRQNYSPVPKPSSSLVPNSTPVAGYKPQTSVGPKLETRANIPAPTQIPSSVPTQPQVDPRISEVEAAAKRQQDFARQQETQNAQFIKDKYNLSNQQLREALPTAQNQFGQFKQNTEASIADLLSGGERQKSQATDYYGDAQRQAAQSRQQVQGQTQKTFANLGTLDSRGEGSFAQATENQDSEFNRFTQQNLKAQADKLSEIDMTVRKAERDARTMISQEEAKMNQLARDIEYAVQNNNLQSAQELTQAYNTAQQYIYDIEDSLANTKYQFTLEQQKLDNELAALEAKNQYGSPESFKGESDLRSEFFTRTKDNKYNEVAQSYDKILNATDSAAGDLGLVFSFMKLLDPSSTVREGEFANAQNATGVPQQVLNAYNRAITGERLNPVQRQDFKNSATTYVAPVIKQQQEAEAYYRKLAQQQGLNPDNVVGGYGTVGLQAGPSYGGFQSTGGQQNNNDPLGLRM